jgi:hypothetical protein
MSVNIARRHKAKGALAMAAAKARSVSEQSMRQAAAISKGLVLQFAPDLADGVLAGSVVRRRTPVALPGPLEVTPTPGYQASLP